MTPATAQPAPPLPPGVAQGTAPMAVPPPPPGARGMRGERQVHMMVMSDRTMTRDKVVQHVSKLFARLDTNHDGFVTRDEVEALHIKMMMGMDGMERGMHAMSGMPGMMAMHGDMAKAMAEHDMPTPDPAAMFDQLDTNHDGMISRQVFLAAKPQVERRMFVMRNGGAPGGPGEHMLMRMHGMDKGTGMGMGGFVGHLFDMADANHDGRISLQEAQAAALAHFDRADLNHDGKVTPDERRQMHQAMRLERRAS